MKSLFAVFAIPLVAFFLQVGIYPRIFEWHSQEISVLVRRAIADAILLFAFWALLKLDIIKL